MKTRERELERQAVELMGSCLVGRTFEIRNDGGATDVELRFPGDWTVRFRLPARSAFSVVKGFEPKGQPEFTFSELT